MSGGASTGHYMKKCRFCEKVYEQCRCPSKEKTLLWGVCRECREAGRDKTLGEQTSLEIDRRVVREVVEEERPLTDYERQVRAAKARGDL